MSSLISKGNLMLAGHYAVALGVKAFDRSIPLWFLMVVAQLVDIFFLLFVLVGIEHMRIVPGFTKTYPLDMYHFPITHSLIMIPAWCLFGALLYRSFNKFKYRSIALISVAIASHWFLDLIVHPEDLLLIMGSEKVGFGLWNFPFISILLEITLVGLGAWLFFNVRPLTQKNNHKFIWILCGILILLTIFMPYYPPPKSTAEASIVGLFLFLILPLLAYFYEKGMR